MDLVLQQRQIVRYHVPNQQRVDAPVTVNQSVAKSDDSSPRDAFAASQLDRKSARGLADDLESPHPESAAPA
jgi:hypothetical protein